MTAGTSPVQVLFDVTRLMARQGASPTGIDRVDLAYLEALSAAADIDLRLVRFGALAPSILPRSAGTRLLAGMTERWRRPGPARMTPALAGLQRWLVTPPGGTGTWPYPAEPATSQGGNAGGAFARAGRLPSLRRVLDARRWNQGIYLNTSHGHLFRRTSSAWLGRTALRSVFFVHDLIPIEFPQFNRPQEPLRHVRRIETVAAHASLIIVNSETTRTNLADYLARRGLRRPPVRVLPLGVEAPFCRNAAPLQSAAPYFVVLSTIEPRKNHLMLLQIWRELVETLGAAAPRLVLIGRRGWENQAVFDLLDRSPGLAGYVLECPGLDDQALASVLRGARALLSPSLAEGFSLPVAEALATGTAVIASAIPAHREIAGTWAELLEPRDRAAWRQAVLDYAGDPSPRRERQLSRIAPYQPPRWDNHFTSALSLLRETAAAGDLP